MDPDTELLFNYFSLFHVYKSGRIERFTGTDVVPAAVDPGTDVVPAAVDPVTGVTTKDVTIDEGKNIAARLYLPKINHSSGERLPILFYFHGGAFCIQSSFSPKYQPFLTSLVSQADLLAVSVNYRLATEHLLPTAYEDSWVVVKWALSSGSDAWLAEHGDFEQVFVAGDSAGANIAHQMAIRAASNGLDIERMVLIHPFFWGREAVGSESSSDIQKREFIEKLWSVVNLPGVDIDHPWINPIAEGAPSLRELGCRRVMVCVAEKDVLAERGRAYVEALKESGWNGEVELVESRGEDHVFHLNKPGCDGVLELMDRLVSFLTREEGKLLNSSVKSN